MVIKSQLNTKNRSKIVDPNKTPILFNSLKKFKFHSLKIFINYNYARKEFLYINPKGFLFNIIQIISFLLQRKNNRYLNVLLNVRISIKFILISLKGF